MSIVPSPRFYVYVLCRPNGKPFYVGKGQGPRVYHHEKEARTGHKCHKCNVIRKIWKQGGQVQRYIVLETDNEQEAFDYERQTIVMYGRENLCNQTDGGEGASGLSEETRKSLAWDRKKRLEHNRKLSADPAIRARISAGVKAYWATKSAEERSAINHGSIPPHLRFPDGVNPSSDPAVRAKISESVRAYWAAQSPDARKEYMARAQRARWAKRNKPPDPSQTTS